MKFYGCVNDDAYCTCIHSSKSRFPFLQMLIVHVFIQVKVVFSANANANY